VMQDRYDYAFLRNDARPAAVIVYEGFANDDMDAAFRRDFNGEFRGPDNAGKAMFVEAKPVGDQGVANAIDVKTLGLTQKDARFIERYDAKLRAICVAFGVPLTVLGDASGRTFANASEEFRVFWAQTMVPLMAEVADAINLKLAPLFGDNVCWFDISKVEALKRKVDPITAQVGAPSMVQAQLMTINEARQDYGLPPVDDGDRMMTAAEILALKQAATPQETPRAAAIPDTREQTADASDVPAVPRPAPAAVRAGDAEQRWSERRAKAVIASTAQVNALEHTWARTFTRLFARQAKETLARLEGKRGRQALREQRAPEPDQVFNRSHWQQVTESEAEGLVEAVFAAGAGRVAGDFGIEFDIEDAYVREFVRDRANKLAGQVTDTTYAQITDALAQGVQAGETIPEIAQRVRHVFDIATEVRSETIARTEVISAYNGSATTVAAQLPSAVVGGQEWIAVEDARTRPRHAAADGEIVPIGQPFISTGEAMAYPGDPNGSAENIVNCRCTVAFLTPDEMDARCRFVETRAALAVLAMVRHGDVVDELALRRALREARAA
jgi:SPP1 gp7 family putative phage head morphogenesis protein